MNAIPLEQAEQQVARRIAPIRVIDPIRWQGQPVPQRRWMVDDLIPHGSVTMLGGDGGLGKSLLTLQLLMAAATRRSWLGLGTMPCRTLGVFCEDDPDEIHRRMADICDHEHMAFTDLEDMQLVSRVGMANEFVERDKYGKPRGPSAFFHQVLSTAKQFGAQLVVLDGLHDLFDGNENSRPEARQFVNLLRKIALDIDGAVVLCAHPSMSGLSSGSGTSGSTAWNNAVRSRLYLSRPKAEDGGDDVDPDVRTIQTKKSNYGKCGDTIRIRWKQGVFVREDTSGPGGIFGTIARHAAEKAFLDCLDAVTEQGRHVSDARNSPRYAPKVFPIMPQAAGTKAKDFERAMAVLFNDGRIKVGSVLGPDRHPVKAIVRGQK